MKKLSNWWVLFVFVAAPLLTWAATSGYNANSIFTGVPSDVNLAGVSATEGTSLAISRKDHGHSITGTLDHTHGGTDVTAVTDDTVLVANGSVWQSKALPNCVGSTSALNYTAATNSWSCATVSVSSPAYSTVQEEGVAVAQESTLDFIGPAVTATDDGAGSRTKVTIVASGVGSCGANSFVTATNDGSAPTCTQPAFSDLSGSATDAQIPNSITVDLATASSSVSCTGCVGPTQIASTAVSAGSYTNSSLTVDADGRLTAASSGTAPVTNVTGTSPISSTGGTTPAISLNDTAVTAASYGSATQVGTFTVDAKGRLTAASNVTITGTAPGGSAGGDLASTYPNPEVAAVHETSGPTKLTIGTIVDGEFLKRSGSTLISGVPTATGTAGGDLSGSYPNPAVAALTETSGPTSLVIGTITDGQFLKRVGSTLVSAAVSSSPTGSAGGDLAGTYPNPTVTGLTHAGSYVATISTTAPLAGGVVGSNAAALTLSLNNSGVTYAKIQDVAALSVIGRSANSTGVSAEISAVAAAGTVLRESGSTIGFGTIDTGAIGSGTLPIARGGSGLATRTAHAIQVGNGTSALTQLVLGTSTTLLHGAAAGDPTWGAVSLTADVTGVLPGANGGAQPSWFSLGVGQYTGANSGDVVLGGGTFDQTGYTSVYWIVTGSVENVAGTAIITLYNVTDSAIADTATLPTSSTLSDTTYTSLALTLPSSAKIYEVRFHATGGYNGTVMSASLKVQ